LQGHVHGAVRAINESVPKLRDAAFPIGQHALIWPPPCAFEDQRACLEPGGQRARNSVGSAGNSNSGPGPRRRLMADESLF
jgi:hypothetical protein